MGLPAPLTQPGPLLPWGSTHSWGPRRASRIPPGLFGTPILLGHPRGFVNCSRPPPSTSEPPGKGPKPFSCLRPISGSTFPPAAPCTLLKARLMDRKEENVLWNLYVFIVDFAQPGAPRCFLALQGLVLGDASGRFLPASSYEGALNPLGEREAIGVAQEHPSCGGEGGKDSGFPGPSAIGAFLSLRSGAPLGTRGCTSPSTLLLCPPASKCQWPFKPLIYSPPHPALPEVQLEERWA